MLFEFVIVTDLHMVRYDVILQILINKSNTCCSLGKVDNRPLKILLGYLNNFTFWADGSIWNIIIIP